MAERKMPTRKAAKSAARGAKKAQRRANRDAKRDEKRSAKEKRAEERRANGDESPSQRVLQAARVAVSDVARTATAAARRRSLATTTPTPHLGLVRAPSRPLQIVDMGPEITVATYNVHRWTGLNGRAAPDPARAGFVISELDADVIALQEVLRPTVSHRGGSAAMAEGDDPLADLSEALGLHLAFAVTREHKRGQLGNAILSRFPICSTSVLDISHSRLERRGALAAQFNGELGHLGIVATHLSLVDRTRQRQVQSLLDHPQLHSGPAILLGDMNAWRNCKATRELDETMATDHNNLAWPASFPSAAPVLALDRIYTQRAKVIDVHAHDSAAARRASDHLPVVARVRIKTAA